MTREEAIDKLKGFDFIGSNEDIEFQYALDMAIKALEQEPRWIPVSERLPEENGQYLVTVKNLTGYEQLYNNVFECEFFEKDWIFKGWKDNKVIAWMPLPQPYKADKDYKAEVITRGNCMMCGKELTEGLFFCKECEDKANSRK